MEFPKYWARGESTAVIQRNPQTGRKRALRCWGWSEKNLAEARALGEERAHRLAQRIRSGEALGRYPYGTPFREEVLEKWSGSPGPSAGDGATWAVISRNAYGCRVLNTADILFADLDAPSAGLSWTFLFKTILGQWQREIEEKRRLWEIEAGERIAELVRSRGCGLRVYRTFAGLRCLLTTDLADPESDETLELLESLGSDPLYVRLCRARSCFRARLTPKPWRCGVPALDVEFPWQEPEDRARMRHWVARYEEICPRFSTCDLVANLGPKTRDERIARVIEYHDRETGALTQAPLA